jgi:uncharacterized membrane protein
MSYFVYSRHATRERAEMALEDYYATGEISESERPYITHIRNRWCVMFPAS